LLISKSLKELYEFFFPGFILDIKADNTG